MKVKFDQQQKPIPSHILSNSVHCCYTLIFLLCLYLGSFTNPRITSFLISVPSVFIISLTVFLILSNCFISSNQEILIKMKFKAPRLQFNNNTGKLFNNCGQKFHGFHNKWKMVHTCRQSSQKSYDHVKIYRAAKLTGPALKRTDKLGVVWKPLWISQRLICFKSTSQNTVPS